MATDKEEKPQQKTDKAKATKENKMPAKSSNGAPIKAETKTMTPPPVPELHPSLDLSPIPLSPSDEKTWGMLSHLSVLLNLLTGLGGPIAALVIYLVYKERSRFVAYHALQALVFQLIWWVGGGALAGISWAVSGALSVVFIGLLCMPIACLLSFLPLAGLIYGIVGAVQTSQGQDFKYWLIGDWVRGTLTGS